MNKRELRRRELLDELARRFHDSADTLRSIARRIESAGRATLAARRGVARANQRLCADLDVRGAVPFSYREYLEFSTADEFRRFADAAVITDADIQSVDWSRLLGRLAPPKNDAAS